MIRAALAVALLPLAAVTVHVARGEMAGQRPVPRHERPAPVAPVAPDGVGDTTRLTSALQRSVTLAIAAARRDGVTLRVASGWRSRAHQQRLYEDAVAKYGSPAAARRWVLPPGESAHVRGEAVDVAPPAAADWLARHGVRFGLCRRYANEPWHFERLAGPKGSVCPPLEPHA